jgi:energy-coupling factor transport system ATP-binding protein
MAAVLEANQVAYRYPQNAHGLAPLCLTLAQGERMLVAGPSGCGKSTLARCLTGLIPHLYRGSLAGEVWVDGLLTVETPLWQLAERAGLVFQNPASQMLARTVQEEITFGLENLGLDPPAMLERLEEALVRFGLAPMRRRAPQTLSGGEQQKLALAAIMARQPPILVLDEPLSMLDGTAAAELVSHVVELADSGTTIAICEHREEYLRVVPGLRTLRLAGPQGRVGPETSLPPVRCAATASPLQVSGVTVRLGGRTILQELSLEPMAGEVIAVVGRNGVGKTTLLRALAGLVPFEGSIVMEGGQPDLGLVYQNADLQLFNATVSSEILYRVPEPDMALYGWLLDALALAGYEDTPPLLLSEGEKKRVALATVLMRRPRHGLLLDEPSVGQDADHKTMLMGLAHALAGAGYLVILTTHDLTLAARADRIVLLGAGGVVADGQPDWVLRDDGAWASVGLTVPDWVFSWDCP